MTDIALHSDAVSKSPVSIVYKPNNGIPVRLQFNDGEGGVMLWADVSARPGIRKSERMKVPQTALLKWQTISGILGLTVVFAVLIGGAWAAWSILTH